MLSNCESLCLNSVYQITLVEHNKSTGATISSFSYAYNNAGNRTRVVESDGTRTTWTYDAASQLTREERASGDLAWNSLAIAEWEALTLSQWENMDLVAYDTTFTYDPVGNRLTRVSSSATTTYTYDVANQLKTSIDLGGTTTYTFDNVGNQLTTEYPASSVTTNTWDDENRLTQVDLPTGVDNQYSYNGDGKRIQIIDSSGTRKLIWNKENILLETSSGGVTQVVYSLEPAFYGIEQSC